MDLEAKRRAKRFIKERDAKREEYRIMKRLIDEIFPDNKKKSKKGNKRRRNKMGVKRKIEEIEEFAEISSESHEEIFIPGQPQEFSEEMSIPSLSQQLTQEISLPNEIVDGLEELKTEPEEFIQSDDLINEFAAFPHEFPDEGYATRSTASELTSLPLPTQFDTPKENEISSKTKILENDKCKKLKLSPSRCRKTEFLFQAAIKTLPKKKINDFVPSEDPVKTNDVEPLISNSIYKPAPNTHIPLKNLHRRTGRNSSMDLKQILDDLEDLGMGELALSSDDEEEEIISSVHPDPVTSAKLWNEIIDLDQFDDFYKKFSVGQD